MQVMIKNNNNNNNATNNTDMAPSPISFAFADDDGAGGIGAAKAILPRSRAATITPPPTSFTPTQINISSRGDDEVHPLAMAALTRRKQQMASLPSMDMEDDKHANQEPNIVTVTRENSLEMSDVTSAASVHNQPTGNNYNAHHLAKSAPSVKTIQSNNGANISTSDNKNKLNPKQQAAMDNFLKAQLSGNPIAREEMWKELVRAMKTNITDDQSSHQSGYNNNNNNHNRPHRGRAGSRGSNNHHRSMSNNKRDDILGLIRIGGGLKIGAASDAVSIESGLTSKDDYYTTNANTSNNSNNLALLEDDVGWDAGQWQPSPHPSPARKDDVVVSTDNQQQGTSKTTGGAVGVVGGVTTVGEGAAAVTPPNVPMLSNLSAGGKQPLPMISPLSTKGSFDRDENPLNVTGETTIYSQEGMFQENNNKQIIISGNEKYDKEINDRKKTKEKRRKSKKFFDIGESFADNTKHLSFRNTIDNSALGTAITATDNNDVDDPDPSLSLADLSDGDSSSTSSEQHDESEKNDISNLLPSMLPSKRWSENMVVNPPQPLVVQQQQQQQQNQTKLVESNITTSSDNWNSLTANMSLIAHSIDGEVMSFQEMEEHSGKVFAPPVASRPPAVQQPPRQLNQLSIQKEAVISPRKDVDPSTATATGQPCRTPTPTTQLPTTSQQRSSSRRRPKKNNTATVPISLEEQILNVLQQQPESHIALNDTEEDEKEEEAIAEEEEVLFGRSSPILSPLIKKGNNKKKKKSGALGPAASAQDILKELRSSTPCTFQSGGNNSLNGGRNKPPRSISIGEGGQPPQVPKEHVGAVVAVAQATSTEEPSDKSSSNLLRSPTPPLALAPSRRDLPRPHRINRRSASEPTPPSLSTSVAINNMNSAAAMSFSRTTSGSGISTTEAKKTMDSIVSKPMDDAAKAVLATSSSFDSSASNKSRDISMSASREDASEKANAVGDKPESPLEIYCKTVGLNQEAKATTSNKTSRPLRRRSRLFPYTSPATSTIANGTSATTAAPQQYKSTIPFDDGPNTNPFDSPPRQPKPKGTMEDPFEEQSSPIPLDRSTISNSIHSVSVSMEQPYSLSSDKSAASAALQNHSNSNSSNNTSGISSCISHPSERAVAMSVTYTSEKAVATSNNSCCASPSSLASSARAGISQSPTLLLLPPSKRDTLYTARSSPSLASQMKILNQAGYSMQGIPSSDIIQQPEQQSRSISSSSSTQSSCSSSSSNNNNHLDEIRASISQLKNNGVGGIGKSTSTLVRNEETGRYVIRDVDDDHFHDIIIKAEDDDLCVRAVITEEEESCCSDEEEMGVVESSRCSNDDISDNIKWPSSNEQQSNNNFATVEQSSTSLFMQDKTRFNLLQKSPRSTTPMSKFMMGNQIMNESVLDDDAVDDAVWAATQCLSTASSTTSNGVSIETEAALQEQQEVEQQDQPVETSQDVSSSQNDNEDDEQDFFVICRPASRWNEKWSAFESDDKGSSSLNDDFDVCPSSSMDEWGVSDGNNGDRCGDFDDDDDSFAPAPQWDCNDTDDDGDCWGREEKNVNEMKNIHSFASPTSVLANNANHGKLF
mmetsp:Transcript_25436/g.54719  ORF Transcript_25436/g.54719 Transcript_25436/m.54719 type:complete len:1566 (+) Transcript_25436:130-4827(+)